MAAEDDKEDNESNTHSKSALNAVIRNAKKANKAVKITQAPTPRAAPLTKKKKAAKNGFEKELGVNGAAEKSARLERARDPDAPVKKSLSVKGGSAGKASKVGGTKRENKASKRS